MSTTAAQTTASTSSPAPTLEVLNDPEVTVWSATLTEVGTHRGAPLYELLVNCDGNGTWFEACGATLYIFPGGKPDDRVLENLEDTGPSLMQVVVHGLPEDQVTPHLRWSRGQACLLLTVELEDPAPAKPVAELDRFALRKQRLRETMWLSLDLRRELGRWLFYSARGVAGQEALLGADELLDLLAAGADVLTLGIASDLAQLHAAPSAVLTLEDPGNSVAEARYRIPISGNEVRLTPALAAHFDQAPQALWLRII